MAIASKQPSRSTSAGPRRPASARALRERWSSLLQAAPDAVALTEGFTVSPFPTVDGRLDFRGLPIFLGRQPSAGSPSVALGHIGKADFSHSAWGGANWYGGAFSQCLFNGAELGSAGEGSPVFLGVAWNDGCFDGATLFGVRFADATGMTDCSFEGTTLRGAAFSRISLLRCRFIRCRWGNAGRNVTPSISHCRLRDCVFEGGVRGLSISDFSMHGGAFSGELFNVSMAPWGDALHSRCVDRAERGKAWLPTPFDQVPMQLRGVDLSQAQLVAVTWSSYTYLHDCILPPPATHCIYANDDAVYQALVQAAQNLPGEEGVLLADHIALRLKPFGSVPHQVVCPEWELSHSLGREHGEALANAYFALVSRTVDSLGARVTGRGPVDAAERSAWPMLPALITPLAFDQTKCPRGAPLAPRSTVDPALRERWLPLLGEHGNALALTESFTHSPFGRVNGLLDLRGLPVGFGVDPCTHDQPALALPSVADVDFSGSHWLPAHWYGGALVGCLLDDAQFEYGTTFWATQFARCRFVGGLLDRCNFQDGCTLTDCRFEATTFNRVHFKDCRLTQCRFEQVVCVTRLQFYGCTLQDSAFDPEPPGLGFVAAAG